MTIEEKIEKVDKWYKKKFPRAKTGRAIVPKRYKKLLEEVGELGEEIMAGTNKLHLSHEIADCQICLYIVARECEIDLGEAVDKKLKVLNRRLRKK